MFVPWVFSMHKLWIKIFNSSPDKNYGLVKVKYSYELHQESSTGILRVLFYIYGLDATWVLRNLWVGRSLMWFKNNKSSTKWTRSLDGKAWLWQAAVVLAVKRWQLSNSWCPLSRQPPHDTLSVLGSRSDDSQFTTAFVLLCETPVHYFHTSTDTTTYIYRCTIVKL